MKLEAVLIKNLVQDIEASAKTRKAFNLKKLVDEKAHTYGQEGTEKRRSLQKKFDQIKRKTPQEYQRFLDKIEVNPGEGLKRELRDINNESSSESSDSETSSESSDGETTKVS